MEDVRIRRCTLRVVRRGGWSWGPDPERLAAAAARALPALVARELAGQLAGRAAAVQTSPVRVRVRVTREELAELVRGAAGPGGAAGAARLPPRHAWIGPERIALARDGVPVRLARRLAAAVAIGLADTAVAAGWRDAEEPVERAVRGQEQDQAAEAQLSAGSPLLAMFAAWQDAGSLALRLAGASTEDLEAWERELLARAGAPTRPAGVDDAAVARVVRAALAALAPQGRARAPEARLAVAMAVHRALGLHPADPALRAALAAAVPELEGDRSLVRTPVIEAAPAEHTPRLQRSQEQHVASALPFLVLGALARLGWLGAAAAFLHADHEAGPDRLAVFATAIAHKLLAPPERGWRRSDAATHAAACFAGIAAPLPDAALAHLAAHLEGRTGALDEAARASFLSGHGTGDPLVLARARHAGREGWLLAEARGAFPLAWGEHVAALDPVMGALAGELVLVPSTAASPATLAWLDARGSGFVTDASPGRGEPWRALTGESSPRLHANERGVRAGVAPAEARALAGTSERVVAAWHAIAEDRPAVPRSERLGLDASLALAVSLALADMAWRLFRDREPTCGQLVLDRFASLDAQLRVEADTVRVRLPLGRRHQDLLAHGMLADVPRLPWWEGRTLVFTGG